MNGMHASTRVALVTGGSSGLGAALCVALAARGWHEIGLAGRGQQPGERTDFGIRVCLAEPGFIRTDLARSAATPEQPIADYATVRQSLCEHWTASVAAGMAAEHAARDIVHWALDGRGVRRRFGTDGRWLPCLKAALPESAYAAGLRRRFRV